MKKIRIGGIIAGGLLVIFTMLTVRCGNGGRVKESPVVAEMPDTVYRAWDEINDEDYLKTPEDKRFRIENADGSILIFAVNADEETVDVYGGNPNGVEIFKIPGEVEYEGKKYGVRNIASHAFATFSYDSVKWMTGVKEIVIGEGIEHCGVGCFGGAPDMVKIHLPASLMNIGYTALANCEKLEKVEIAEESNLLMIEDFAFMNCMSLREFKIPAGVRRIRQGPWRNCKALSYLTVADGNKEYKAKDGVLYSISGRQLVQYPAGKRDKEYVVESGTMEIDNSAFYGNGYLEKVEFPNSLETIQHGAFIDCTALKEVEFNVGLRWIGNAAFEGCRSLKKVRLPGNAEYTRGNEYGYDTFPEWTKVR